MKLYSDYIYENEIWDEYFEDNRIYEGLILNGIKKIFKKLFHIKKKRKTSDDDYDYDYGRPKYGRYSKSYTPSTLSSHSSRSVSKLNSAMSSGRFSVDDSCKAYDKITSSDVANADLYDYIFLNVKNFNQSYKQASTVYNLMNKLLNKATDNYKEDRFPYFTDRYCKHPKDVDFIGKSYFFEILSKENVNVPLSVASIRIDDEQENSDEDKINVYIDVDFISNFDNSYKNSLKTLYTITIKDLIDSIKKICKNKSIKVIYKTDKANSEKIRPILKNEGFSTTDTALIKNI